MWFLQGSVPLAVFKSLSHISFVLLFYEMSAPSPFDHVIPDRQELRFGACWSQTTVMPVIPPLGRVFWGDMSVSEPFPDSPLPQGIFQHRSSL